MNNKQAQLTLKKNTWDNINQTLTLITPDTDLIHAIRWVRSIKSVLHPTSLASTDNAHSPVFPVGELKYGAAFLNIRGLKCDEW